MIKWFIIFLMTASLNAQSMWELLEQKARLDKGDTLILNNLRSKINLLFFLMVTSPNAQIMIMNTGGYNPPPPDLTPPDIPSNIHLVGVADDSLLAYWTNPPEADFYKVYIKLDDVLTDSTINDSIYFTGLTANTYHYIALASEDTIYNLSEYSDTVGAYTLTAGGTIPEPPDLFTPGVLTAETYGDQIQVRFEEYNLKSYPSGYPVLERSTNGTTGWTAIDSTITNQVFFKDSNVVYYTAYDSLGSLNTTRYYRYRFSTGTYYSDYSNTASAKTAQRLFYISTSGDDTDPGTSLAQAWRNLSKANPILIAGDALYVNKGTYFQINPLNSGSSGSPISYIAMDKDSTFLSSNISLIEGEDWINVRGFRPIGTSYVRIKDGSNILIEEVIANPSVPPTGNVPVNFWGNASYITIRNCFFRGTDQLTVGLYQDLCHIQPDANHILLEGSYFIGGTHNTVIQNGDYVIYKNTFHWNKYHHNIGILSGGQYAVLDHNFLSRAGVGNYNYDIPGVTEGSFTAGASLRLAENCKVRRNIIQYGGASDIIWGFVGVFTSSWLGGDLIDNNNYRNYIVHNNIVNNHNGGLSLGVMSESDETAPYLLYGQNKIKNNVIWNNHKIGLSESVNVIDKDLWYFFSTNGAPPYAYPYPPAGDTVEYNLIGDGTKQIRHYYYSSGSLGTDYYSRPSDGSPYAAQNTYIYFANNISGDPLFVENDDTAGISVGTVAQDFRVGAASPVIDAGGALTLTNGAGTGTSVVVDDAGYFFDGWDITQGDRIQIGTEIVRITNIVGNILTIDRSITWADNAEVSFPYNGNGQDIGVIER